MRSWTQALFIVSVLLAAANGLLLWHNITTAKRQMEITAALPPHPCGDTILPHERCAITVIMPTRPGGI